MADEQAAAQTSREEKPSALQKERTGEKPKSQRTAKTSKSKPKVSAGRRRGPKPYPIIPFEQALRIGQGISEFGAGHPMKRDTLLEKLGLPLNQTTKDLITASSKYGITIGSHDSAELRLTEDGAKSIAPAASLERSNARIKLAITNIEPFNRLYEKFRGGKMPAVEAMRDCLDDMDEGDRAPCVDIFVQNAKFVGILQTREGAEFITRVEDAATKTLAATAAISQLPAISANQPVPGEDFDTVCFFIAPIGAEDSEHRRHSDAILASYVEKALATVEPKLRVVRADGLPPIFSPGIMRLSPVFVRPTPRSA
jgi:hypothetical protein